MTRQDWKTHTNLQILLLLLLTLLHSTCLALRPPLATTSSRSASQLAQQQQHECLPQLSDRRKEFAKCKSQICFLFIREEPYIILPHINDTNKARFETLFNCSDRASYPPGLGGISFDIFQNLHAQPPLEHYASLPPMYCAWAGNETKCTFKGLVQFLETNSPTYQFAITGLLLDMPLRRLHHFVSAPIINDHVVVVGKVRDSDQHLPTSILKRLIEPFYLSTWIVFFVLFFSLVVLSYLVISCIVPKDQYNIINTLSLLLGHDSLLRYRASNLLNGGGRGMNLLTRNSLIRLRLIPMFLHTALLSLATITILFYELGVGIVLFKTADIQLGKSVTKLSERGLGEFAVLKNSALEDVWNKTVTAEARWANGYNWTNGAPWRQCKNFDDCLQMVLTKKARVKYMVTMESVGRYLLNAHGACNDLAIMQTDDVLYSFNGGWLFNTGVPAVKRQRMNSAMITSRMSGKLKSMIEDGIDDKNCKVEEKTKFQPQHILIPFSALMMPLVLTVLGLLAVEVWSTRRRRKNKVGTEVSSVGVATHDEVESIEY